MSDYAKRLDDLDGKLRVYLEDMDDGFKDSTSGHGELDELIAIARALLKEKEDLETAGTDERTLRFAICPGCHKGIVWASNRTWFCTADACGLKGTGRNFINNEPVHCPNCCGDLAAPTALVKDDTGRFHCEVCKWPAPPVVPDNLHAPMMDVRHADLKRFSEDSPHKSDCPVCPAGVLLMMRDRRTHELIEFDRCIGCGQSVRYTDLVIVRARSGS